MLWFSNYASSVQGYSPCNHSPHLAHAPSHTPAPATPWGMRPPVHTSPHTIDSLSTPLTFPSHLRHLFLVQADDPGGMRPSKPNPCLHLLPAPVHTSPHTFKPLLPTCAMTCGSGRPPGGMRPSKPPSPEPPRPAGAAPPATIKVHEGGCFSFDMYKVYTNTFCINKGT